MIGASLEPEKLSRGAACATPLVSCIMPTYNRRPFIAHAIDYFLRQSYPCRELIILDDGSDAIADLVPPDPRIRYERLTRKISLGAKLNLGCEMAAGEIIAHFDDDDWYAPRRLSYQVETLLRERTELCGINELLYFDLNGGRAFQYRYPPGHKPWLLGSDLCYSKSYWSAHRFAEIDVGMDGLFSWSAAQKSISVLQDSTFAVHMIHQHNVSPKQVTGNLWRSHPVENIKKLLGSDWIYYRPGSDARPRARSLSVETATPIEVSSPAATSAQESPALRNVFAALVHEKPECVIDLVRNLRFIDHDSRIVLYDGSAGGTLLDRRLPWSRWGVEIHPRPRPMKWGQLHGFALDCLHYLKSTGPFDVMTIVDSDQLALRRGYSEFLAAHLGDRTGLGLLSSLPGRQGPATRIAPCLAAHQEIGLWRPFLQRFPDGQEKFVHWTFWPSTVITSEAGLAMQDLFANDGQLARILEQSRLWATEEVLFPTLTALLGFRVERNPCSFAYVKYRTPIEIKELDAAFKRADAYWMHPVARNYADPVRTRIRRAYGDWHASPVERGRDGQPHFEQIWPIVQRMRGIEGWLADEEAELLAIAARETLTRSPGAKTVVEIGSYCGKATYVLAKVAQEFNAESRVLAIDTFDGVVGALDRDLSRSGPTLDKFKRMLEESGLAANVSIHVGRAGDAAALPSVDFLLVDGLHDYASVSQDFYAFEASLQPGAMVAFHDYADYFPGVRNFVDELLNTSAWREVAQAGSMKLLQRCG